MTQKLNSIKEEYKLLLSSVPALITTFFVLSVVLMNILANKVIFQYGDLVAGDGGFLISWIPFLCMDSVTKRFGPRASILLNILAAVINILCVCLFSVVAAIPGNGEDFSAFNSVMGACWFIVLGSMTAFIVSGIANSLMNHAVGKMFSKNPNGKAAFFTRSYVSTFLGQTLDNFIFAFIVYYIFAPIYWGWGFQFVTCIGAAIAGGVLELLCEVIFGPLGYKLCKEWDARNVGAEYIEKYYHN